MHLMQICFLPLCLFTNIGPRGKRTQKNAGSFTTSLIYDHATCMCKLQSELNELEPFSTLQLHILSNKLVKVKSSQIALRNLHRVLGRGQISRLTESLR